jgi:hypothetical protein
MPLAPVWELQLQVRDLCNLELLRRGLYRLRLSVRGAEPVSCAAQPARLHSVSRELAGFEVPDSDLGAEAGGIADGDAPHYLTRSVLVRYVDERFELCETVVFRSGSVGVGVGGIGGGAGAADVPVAVLVELLRADCEVFEEAAAAAAAGAGGAAGAADGGAAGVEHGLALRFGRMRRVVRRTSAFAAVAARTLELPARELLAGTLPAAFFPLLFSTDHLASAGVFLQSAVLAVLPFAAPPAPPPLPALLPLAGVQRPPPVGLQPMAPEQRILMSLFSSASASVASAAAGFVTALSAAGGFVDAFDVTLPAPRGDESLLASGPARAFVAACRERLARPQSLTEQLFETVRARAAARRADVCDSAASALLALERGTAEAAETQEQLRALFDAAGEGAARNDDQAPLRATPAEAQAAHAALLAPLVRAHARLEAQARRVHAISQAQAAASATAAAAVRDEDDGVEIGAMRASAAALLAVCPHMYASSGAASEGDDVLGGSAVGAGGSGGAEAEADAFGARQGGGVSFADRAAATLGDHEAVARALACEAAHVAAVLSASWRLAQRDAAREAGAWVALLSADAAVRAARHVAAATETTILAGAAELLEQPRQFMAAGSAAGAEARYAALAYARPYLLDPVTASVPAALRLVRVLVRSAAEGAGESGGGASPLLTPDCAHLVVFVNGLSGTVHDTRLVRAHLKLRCPRLVCVAAASVQGADTELDIVGSGAKLAAEVSAAIARLADDGLALGRLSIVAFSLGGLIARAALRHPLLRPHAAASAHAFVSLAAPHLGLAYAPSSLFGAGLALRVRVRPSAALSELALADGGAAGADGALLMALARGWAVEGDGRDGEGAEGGDALGSARLALDKHGMR